MWPRLIDSLKQLSEVSGPVDLTAIRTPYERWYRAKKQEAERSAHVEVVSPFYTRLAATAITPQARTPTTGTKGRLTYHADADAHGDVRTIQQRPTEDDQPQRSDPLLSRACRAGWLWQDDQIFSDAGISGASIEGRPGLQALLTAAASTPRSFDVLLVDDSSRVSRDLADALRIVQRLKFAGMRVVYISQGIDSDSEQHETLIAVHGLVDGLYLREMAAKIKRGLKG